MPRISVYRFVWSILAKNAFQEAFVNRGTNAIFIFGKALRLFFSLLFLYLIKENVHYFSGYTTDQIVVIFLIYNLIDLMAQSLYRGVYVFSNDIRSGKFDFSLAKPLSPLFQSLVGKPDINDVLFLVPSIVLSVWIMSRLDIVFTLPQFLFFLVLLINGLVIATTLHIMVLVVGVLTTEVDGVMWTYRDLSQLAQFPVTIYLEPLRFALFFLIPFGMMITLPAEALMGLPLSQSAFWAFAIGFISLLTSLMSWKFALRRYSSASS